MENHFVLWSGLKFREINLNVSISKFINQMKMEGISNLLPRFSVTLLKIRQNQQIVFKNKNENTELNITEYLKNQYISKTLKQNLEINLIFCSPLSLLVNSKKITRLKALEKAGNWKANPFELHYCSSQVYYTLELWRWLRRWKVIFKHELCNGWNKSRS